MNVDLDQLRDRIQGLVHTDWRVRTDTIGGPAIIDRYRNEIAQIQVDHAVWTCDDELDGCPEVARDATRLAQLLCDLPGAALELIQEVKRLRGTVTDLERDLEEAEDAIR